MMCRFISLLPMASWAIVGSHSLNICLTLLPKIGFSISQNPNFFSSTILSMCPYHFSVTFYTYRYYKADFSTHCRISHLSMTQCTCISLFSFQLNWILVYHLSLWPMFPAIQHHTTSKNPSTFLMLNVEISVKHQYLEDAEGFRWAYLRSLADITCDVTWDRSSFGRWLKKYSPHVCCSDVKR